MREKRYEVLLRDEDGSIVFQKNYSKKVSHGVIQGLSPGKYFVTVKTPLRTLMYPIHKK